MSKKLFIGNCDFNMDEDALESFIKSNDIEVSSVQIIRDRETGRSRGFGFAELSGSQNLQTAIDTLNGKEIDGRALTVNEAREQTRNNDRGGRSSGGGRGGYRGNSSSRW